MVGIFFYAHRVGLSRNSCSSHRIKSSAIALNEVVLCYCYTLPCFVLCVCLFSLFLLTLTLYMAFWLLSKHVNKQRIQVTPRITAKSECLIMIILSIC
jgi:hypothetical protein